MTAAKVERYGASDPHAAAVCDDCDWIGTWHPTRTVEGHRLAERDRDAHNRVHHNSKHPTVELPAQMEGPRLPTSYSPTDDAWMVRVIPNPNRPAMKAAPKHFGKCADPKCVLKGHDILAGRVWHRAADKRAWVTFQAGD